MSSISQMSENARMVVEAYCPACERRWEESAEPLTILQAAAEHSSGTGHVVVLNGAAEMPQAGAETNNPAQPSNTKTLDALCCFYVDIPTEECVNNVNGAWKNVAHCSTREEAINFAREHFGADEEGRVCLVSG